MKLALSEIQAKMQINSNKIFVSDGRKEFEGRDGERGNNIHSENFFSVYLKMPKKSDWYYKAISL